MTLHMPSLRSARSEHGFTLMETLVAMVTGLVVTGALLAILEFALREQAQITDRAQANQLGRVAMSNIVDELHSSCTGSKPIQEPSSTLENPLEKSNGKNLWFISSYGTAKSGEPLIEEAYQHDIMWESSKETSSTGKPLGRLVDYSWKTSGNAQEGFKVSSSLTTKNATKVRRIAENIPESSTIFTYYNYNSTGTALEASSLPLSTTKAAENVTKVTIAFTQASTDKDTRSDRTVSFSDSVLLRLDPTTSEEVAPCE